MLKSWLFLLFCRLPGTDDIEVCTNSGDRLSKFHSAMSEMGEEEAVSRCGCYSNCEDIEYEIDVTTKTFSLLDVVASDESCRQTNKQMVTDKYLSLRTDAYTWRLRDYLAVPDEVTWDNFVPPSGLGAEKYHFCNTTIRNNLAKITVVIPNTRTTRVVRSARASFTDRLGVLGKCKNLRI